MPEKQEMSGLAAHLDTISGQVKEKVSSPETHFEEGRHEKEALHEVVGERLGKEGVAAPAPAPSIPTDGDVPSYELPELKAKVDELLSIALSKDLDDAIGRARGQDDPALLDAFHDALTDKLYTQLVESGKIKQI